MGQLLVPALIGAGVGAVGGAVSGQNPFRSALLGAGLGAGGAGLFGAGGASAAAGTAGQGAGAGLIGGANLSTAGGLGIGSGATGGLGGLSNFLSNIKGVELTPVNFGTGGYASGIGGQPIGNMATLSGQSLDEILDLNIPKQNLANITSPEAVANSAFPKFQSSGLFEPSSFRNLDTGTSVGAPFSTEAFTNNPLMSQQIANNAGQTTSMMSDMRNYISNFPTNAMNYVQNNPLTSAKMALDIGTPTPNAPIQSQSIPIRQGDPNAQFAPNFNVDRSSNLSNVSPNVLPQKDNTIGLLNMLQSRMALTDEEKMRLMQLGQRF